ncbi:MAG: hypothetical protein HY043_12365, partial [Verrucomicrobia bacterium]|nr:hypothetical protein [Verrucomicrobiota bacterium]
NLYVADSGNHTIRKVTPAGVVTTLAGLAGSWGSTDGTGSNARFFQPQGVAVDSAGNVYVADTFNHTIRKVSPAGVVTTLAGLSQDANSDGYPDSGNVDGTGSGARFAYPSGVAVDNAGNVYVADTYNHTIRKVTPAGVVTTLAGNAAIIDQFGFPGGGSADGTGSTARFNFPSGVAVDSADNVYVADSNNNTIRKITPAGVVTTLAGLASLDAQGSGVAGSVGSVDGTGSAARFSYPQGVAVDSGGNVYVADSGNHTIRKVTPTGGVTTLAGLAGSFGSTDGTGSDARFGRLGHAGPTGVAVDSSGNFFVADTNNNTIRKVTEAGVVTTLAGLAGGPGSADGMGSAARFFRPSGVTVDRAGNVYVADFLNNTIRKVTGAGVVTMLAGLALLDAQGSVVARSVGSVDGTGSDARFNGPSGVAVDSAGNVYVADSNNNTIRKITPAGVVTTLAGLASLDAQGSVVAGSVGNVDGTGSAARFNGPSGVAVDSAGNVYVADSGNNTIRKVTPTGEVTTLAGLPGNDGYGSADGTGSAARFLIPSDVAVDNAGNLFVVDTQNLTLRKVTPTGVVTTLAGLSGNDGYGSADGTGSDARFNSPFGVAADGAGNVYVADTDNRTIRKVTPSGMVTTLAGLPSDHGLKGHGGSTDGTGSNARFYDPFGVAVDSVGNLYVADTANNTIRKGYPAPRILNSEPGLGFNGTQFGFNLTGPAGKFVVVEASADLVNWLPLWTNTFTFPAALNFSDRQSGITSARFYRARLP